MRLATNVFDTIGGLPLHPLVVHAAVVLFPLALLGLLAIIVSPWARRRLGWVVMVLLLIGAATVPLAKETGEALAHHVGEPEQHAEYADQLTAIAFATTVAAVLWWVLARFRVVRSPIVARIVGAVTAVLAIASLVFTVLVGHSGAVATWEEEASSWSNSATSDGAPTPASAPSSTSSTPGTSGSAPAAGTYTLAQVKAHGTAQDCWAAVDGKVYNLTTWIGSHPGGSDAIRGLCGTDATTAFTRQHGGESEPASRLATFKVGTLAP